MGSLQADRRAVGLWCPCPCPCPVGELAGPAKPGAEIRAGVVISPSEGDRDVGPEDRGGVSRFGEELGEVEFE